MKFYIDYDLNGIANSNNKIMHLGFKNSNKEITKKEIFEKFLSGYMNNESVEIKIKFLLQNFFESDNIEIIQKSITGKDFKNFIKEETDNIDETKKIELKNIAFIARLKENIFKNKIDANAIILTVNLVKESFDSKYIMYFELEHIEIINIQEKNYSHPDILHITENIEFINIKKIKKEQLTLKKQVEEFLKLRNIKKSINIFEEEQDNLKLREQKIFISSFFDYLKQKKDDVFIPYWIEDNEKKFIKLDAENKIFLYFLTDKKISISNKSKKWILSNEYDFEEKIDTTIIKFEKDDLQKLCEEKILKINNIILKNKKIIEFNKTELKTNHENQKKLDNKINDFKQKLIKIKENIQIEKKLPNKNVNIIKQFENNINKNEQDLKKYNINLLKLNKENKNLITKEKDYLKQIEKKEIKIKKIDSLMKSNLKNKKILYKVCLKGIFNNKKSNYKKTFEIPKHNLLDLLKENKNHIQISNFDVGFFNIIKRWLFTFNSYSSGNYKSPYTLISLNKPNVEIEIKENIKIEGLKLNSLQQKALNAFQNAHFASFLQGPPGTGKTQVISAAIINSINNGENIVISSSTNEAINNALDRLYELKNNPNLFLLRCSKSKEQMKKNPQYTSDAIYKNFINNIAGFVEKDNTSISSVDISVLEKLTKNTEFTKKYIPEIEINNNLIKNIKPDEKLILLEKYKEIDQDPKYFEDDLKYEYTRAREKLNRKFKKETEEMDQFIEKNINLVKYNLIDSFDDYKNKFEINSQNNNDKFLMLIRNINKKFNENNKDFDIDVFTEQDKELSLSFSEIAFKNEAINVIGITTTSRLEININQITEGKELFTNYRVDGAIIDEISKSVTPEILSIARLARRFMFAGDYRQLPPQINFDENIIGEFRTHIKKNNNEEKSIDIKRLKEILIKNDIVDNEINFIEWVNQLFSKSLFENQVYKMKSENNNKQTSYVALQGQYRFNKDINELVNLTYDDDEKLFSYKKDDQFKKYSLGQNPPKDDFINIIDSSLVTDDFINEIKKHNLNLKYKESFDSNDSFLIKEKFLSKINDFNAYIIIKIIQNLYEKNPKILSRNIGVITMTRSQATLISALLKKQKKMFEKIEDINDIKIDTVDNFQGREKEIIILDLVRSKIDFKNNKFFSREIRNLDFYKKPERINVAASRAKNKLIIVGAIDYLAKNVTSIIKNKDGEKEIKLFEEWSNIIKKKKGFREWKDF